MKIGIAEDVAILRDALAEALTARGFDVCIAVGDADALRKEIEHQGVPDVTIIDVRMPPTNSDEGVRAAIELRQRHPGAGVLIFSQYVETSHAHQLFGSNAAGVGYLLKDRVGDVREFISAIERIANGETVLDPDVVSALIRVAGGRFGLETLTPRERDVLALMAEGHSNTSIAAKVSLSIGGIEKNIASVFTKLGLEQSNTTHQRVLAVLRYLQG